ncbi:hypothetical protein [Streptomyces sp. NPDC049590]|uniref:hypothetical protein n=1 Tax=Streptomyces sp. NPDC049590 TaxID=3154834 RepID=UPI003415344D
MRTVINRRSVRGGLLSAVMTGSLFLGVTGCGGDGDDDHLPEDYKVVAGTRLCGGHAVSADAARALKVITGSSRFEASGEEYSVAQAATEIAEAFPAPTLTKDLCRVYMPIGTPDFVLRITWGLEEGAPTGAPDPDFTVLKMGERAVAGVDNAYVFFACRSPRLNELAGPAHLAVNVRHWGMPKPPEGDVRALKNAYATVAHSFSLAMAKELRCEKNGGLPAKPVLDPA